MTIEKLKKSINEFKDFPREGVNYKDITPILSDSSSFIFVINKMSEYLSNYDFDSFLGIESRGFIFASALAYKLKKGLILARKLGKLPGKTINENYFLEYNKQSLEIKFDNIKPRQKIIIVDDVIATSGTINAAIKLVKYSKAETVSVISLILLNEFSSLQNFDNVPVHCLIKYNN
jgi:adenine phosphoribosyltransferase